MLYNPPTGGAANDPYVGANIAAGIQGSKVPPNAIEYPQRELVAVITAAGLAPTNTDLQQTLRAVRSGVLEYYVDTGSQNAPAIAPSPAHTSLFDGLHVRVRMAAAPTGPINNFMVNTFGAPIQRVGGAALAGGEWSAKDVVDLVYNASRNAFQISGLTKNDIGVPPTSLWHVGIDTSTSAATITAPVTPAVATRVADLAYLIFPANACAGATQINVGFGLEPLTRNDTSPLQAGDYAAGQPLVVIDDGTQFRLADLTPSQVLAIVIANLPTVAPSLSPARNLQSFTAAGSYSWTVPSNVTWIFRTVVGAGGGGGTGNNGLTYTGGGGGAGGTASGWLQVTPGQTFTCVVGAGGPGSNTNGVAGASGGTSSMGTLAATGGAGGTNNSSGPAGGFGGSGSGGQTNNFGGNGGDGSGTNGVPGGAGGASSQGGGGRTSTLGSNASSAPNGRASGSGGGGIWGTSTGVGPQTGGNGSDGAIYISY